MGFLLNEFEKVRQLASVQSKDKIRILELACACANVLQIEGEKCASAVIDLLFNTKEALDVSKDVRDFIKRSGDKAAQQINDNASKIQFGQ